MEETELVVRMIFGDMDAFDRLMKLYEPGALRTAYLISGNHADSEDIVQDTFVTCYMKRQDIKTPEAFKSYFYRTLSRTAWRICRKKRREQPSEKVYEEALEAPGSVLNTIVIKEEETILYEAILALPVKHRTESIIPCSHSVRI